MRLNSLKNLKNLKIGKSKEKQDGATAGADDTPVAQIAGLEEQLSNKTKDLEATEQQLRELSDLANGSEEHEETSPQPHGPLSELSIESGNELIDEETDVGTLLEKEDEEVKMVEVGAEAAAPAEAEKEPTKEDANDSFNNLFSQEDDEENPLAALINSLPDVTAQELLDDLQEIKEIMRERQ